MCTCNFISWWRQPHILIIYLYQRLQCRDKYFFKIKFVFFLYLRLSALSKENDLPLCIYFWYQTDSGVPNTRGSNIKNGTYRLEFLLCTLTLEVQCQEFHRNHVIWLTKITKFSRNGIDSKQRYCHYTWGEQIIVKDYTQLYS
jgi:hypothetical protein